jgi:hypothetical protein
VRCSSPDGFDKHFGILERRPDVERAFVFDLTE